MNKANQRSKGLKRIGVSEEDVVFAEILMSQTQPCYNSSKLERILGYSNARLRRAKALRLLGVEEEDIDEETSKVLSALGKCGRKRSIRYTQIQKTQLVSKLSRSRSKQSLRLQKRVTRKFKQRL